LKIKILDCTLRDGGYINNWNFTDNQIVKIITALKESNINIIECGYLNDKKGKESNSTLFDTVNTANVLFDKMNIDAQKVVMINLGDFEVSNLSEQSDRSRKCTQWLCQIYLCQSTVAF